MQNRNKRILIKSTTEELSSEMQFKLQSKIDKERQAEEQKKFRREQTLKKN